MSPVVRWSLIVTQGDDGIRQASIGATAASSVGGTIGSIMISGPTDNNPTNRCESGKSLELGS
jgi:hypothetical protein